MGNETADRNESPLLAPRAASGGLERPDVVLRKGMLTLLNGHLTPQQSMIEDLLAVDDALTRAGVQHLLIRGNDIRPVIAIDHRDREQAASALMSAFVDEPFYAKPPGRPALLIADDGLGPAEADVLRVFRPRVEPIGRLRYGASTAVQLEFWRVTDTAVLAPEENAMMRLSLPLSEFVLGSVDRYGRTWQTIEHMFDDHVTDITFPIDIVFSWVDGNAVEYQRARRAAQAGVELGEGDDAPARYRQIDELKYALRSVHMFAPWIRHIYIATDSPTPAWLAEHPAVRIVRSESFFADPSVLPTHNSQAVESQLHHIEGLSEHFIYSNDDMFFGRMTGPSMFFSPGSISKFIVADTRIGLGMSSAERSGFENAARVNRRVLQQRFGAITTRHLEHTATPLRRSVLTEMEHEFEAEFRATAASRFRAADNISVTNSLYHYYALMTGRAIVQENASVRYVDTTLESGLSTLDQLLRRRNVDFFCLNDGSFPEVTDEERTRRVTDFLERYFPIPAPWERAAR